MNGVDILAIEEVAVEFAFNWAVFWIIVVGAGIVGALYGVYQDSGIGEGWRFILVITVGFIIIGAVCGIFAGGIFGRIPTKYEPQYKVTISDEVTMTEFLEKYEIIETEGKIYTVREISND